MNWTDLEAVVKVAHSVKAAVVINNDGRARLNLSFSEPFFRELGSPTKCQVQAGSGDDLGKLRIVPGTGKIEVRELGKGGGRMQVALPAGLPIRVRELEPCEVLDRPAAVPPAGVVSAWIVNLPLDAWTKQGQAAPKAPPPPAAPAIRATVHNATRPLDAAEYLKKNGVRASRLAGDWWQIDGTRTPRLDVLARVNEIRRRNDLPALGVDNIE